MDNVDAAPSPVADASLRARILGAAFSAFMEHGYAGASTLDIARRAKVSKRDLYALFGSKQAMLAACIAERVERMRSPLALPEPRDRGTLSGILSAFGRQLLQEVSQPEVLATYRLAILEAERAPEVARTLDTLGRADNHRALAAWLGKAQAADLLGAGSPQEMAERFIAVLWAGGLLTRLLLRVAPPPDAAECERRAAAATAVLLR